MKRLIFLLTERLIFLIAAGFFMALSGLTDGMSTWQIAAFWVAIGLFGEANKGLFGEANKGDS